VLQAHPFWRQSAAKGGEPALPKLRLPRETAFEAYVERSGLLAAGQAAAEKVGASAHAPFSLCGLAEAAPDARLAADKCLVHLQHEKALRLGQNAAA
jgi:hypothetical protein